MAINRHSTLAEQDQQPSTQQSSNELTLVPFEPVDGYWILSEDYLDGVFQKMVDQDLIKTTFWEGSITDPSHFVNMATNKNNHVVFFLEGMECVGFAWLSGVTGNYAFAHFCFFKEVWGRATEIGKVGMDYWFSWPGTDGPLLDVIVGIMPGFNERAHSYVEKLGWTRLGVIPGMFRDRERNREDAVVYYATRE